jgi:hypothetical protein
MRQTYLRAFTPPLTTASLHADGVYPKTNVSRQDYCELRDI